MKTDQKILNIQELGSGDIKKRINEGYDAILIPMGSCERHGNPYTPLGLDGLVCGAVVERAAQKTDVFHMSLMPFGYAPEHFGRLVEGCGTVSLRAETYRSVLEDISRCLIYHGFNKLIFVSYHNSNIAVAEEVLLSIRAKTGAFVVFYGGRDYKKSREILGSSPDRLSSDIEAAIAMALMEERFNSEGYLSHGYRVHAPGWMGPAFSKRAGTGIAVRFQGSENIILGMDDFEYVSPIAHGDPQPSKATPEKGRMLLDMISEHLSAFVEEVKTLRVDIKSRDYPERVR
ncbi:MAG: creatininase family protein [Thermodesulfobacteriota bacterium]